MMLDTVFTREIFFTREILKIVHRDVHSFAPDVKVLKDAWVHNAGRNHWEFHGPGGFYWHGRASNAYEARAKGWQEWLNKFDVSRAALDKDTGKMNNETFYKEQAEYWRGIADQEKADARLRIKELEAALRHVLAEIDVPAVRDIVHAALDKDASK